MVCTNGQASSLYQFQKYCDFLYLNGQLNVKTGQEQIIEHWPQCKSILFSQAIQAQRTYLFINLVRF